MVNCIEQDSLRNRRSVYGLGKLSASVNGCLEDSIKSCLLNCPTPFNVQSARLVILLNKHHQILWDKIWNNLKGIIPSQRQKVTEEKIKGFAKAYGTILFFEDKDALRELKKQFPAYRKNMKIWTQQANGMLQFMIWQIMAENNIGASLQHYNEIIEDDVYSMYDLPKNWELVAQMPFGSIEKEPAEKTFLPLDERVKIFK
ncbi:MAG: nitroreductase family protein [Alphaproteobacteria bacterium]|nr:nitroreductase family protein [Alphaproteobacteria bacterium]